MARTFFGALLIAALVACTDGTPTQVAVPPGTAAYERSYGLTLLKLSGDEQAAPPGSVLPEPITVRVAQARGPGSALRNHPVHFAFYGPDGSLVEAVTLRTDETGTAASSWTLTVAPGTHRAIVTSPASAAVEFTAEAIAGWTDRASLGTPRFGHATAVVNGKIYVMGGLGYAHYCGGALASVEAYDPQTDTWSPRAPMPGARFYTSGAAVLDGKIYVPGGWECSGNMYNLFVYDVATDSWSDAGPLPGRTSAGFAHAIDGYIYILNAWTGTEYRGDLYRYHPASASWQQLATVQLGHAYGASGVIDGKIVVVGGEIQNKFLHTYDPATDTWTRGPDAPYWLQHNDGAVIDGRLYVVGGSYELGSAPHYYSDRVLIYDPAVQQFSERPALPFPRQFGGVAAVGGTLYVLGGQAGSDAVATAVVQAWTP